MERYKRKYIKEAIDPISGEELFYCCTCTKLFSTVPTIGNIRCPHCGSKNIQEYKV